MAFIVSVPIPILIPMPRFQYQGLEMALLKFFNQNVKIGKDRLTKI